MQLFNFKVSLHLNYPVLHQETSKWFPLLANIYGTQTKSFDGYVSSVEYSDKVIILYCYLVEDTDNSVKLTSLKERYSDWNGYQKICIMDSVRLYSRLLGYSVSSIDIT